MTFAKIRPPFSNASTAAGRFRGQCLCGAVSYVMEPPWLWFAHCHCSICRRHHGSLFSTSIGVRASRFGWLSGADDVMPFRASPAFERPFCRRCGSKVPGRSHRTDAINVPAGTVDGDVGRPRTHIFVASRAPCDALTDDLPRFDAYPDGVDVAPLPEPRRGAARPGVVAGGCLCGAVAFEIDGVRERLVHDHGVAARRSRGAAYATDAIVAAERLRFVRGGDGVVAAAIRAPDVPERETPFSVAFCGGCGALLPALARAAGKSEAAAIVPIGAVDSPPASVSAVHSNVEDGRRHDLR